MFRFGIRFIGSDYLRHYRARQRVYRTAKKQENDLPRRCAVDYSYLVRRNLTRETYRNSGRWTPYNKQYLKWKLKTVGHDKSWQLFGDLLNTLTFFKVQSGWMGGIPSGIMGQSGKSYGGRQARRKPGYYGKAREIAWYGKIVERTKPLFEPTGYEYASKGWKKRARLALSGIKREWRK